MNIPYGLQRSGYDVGSFKYNKYSQKKVYFKLLTTFLTCNILPLQ